MLCESQVWCFEVPFGVPPCWCAQPWPVARSNAGSDIHSLHITSLASWFQDVSSIFIFNVLQPYSGEYGEWPSNISPISVQRHVSKPAPCVTQPFLLLHWSGVVLTESHRCRNRRTSPGHGWKWRKARSSREELRDQGRWRIYWYFIVYIYMLYVMYIYIMSWFNMCVYWCNS